MRLLSGPAKAGPHVLLAILLSVSVASAAGQADSVLAAAERGDRAAALKLLARGANPNTPGPDGTTAIMWAASNDDLELVRALIAAKASVTPKNHFGTTAITEAAIVGSEK